MEEKNVTDYSQTDWKFGDPVEWICRVFSLRNGGCRLVIIDDFRKE